MNKKIPIIFIHYGDNDYLKYVFKSACSYNTRVILLGDKSNRKYTKIGVEHYYFDKYLYGNKVVEFRKFYKRIGGVEFEKINASKGGSDWTKFNFLKWFALKNLIEDCKIDSFWTFDSDTLILTNLNRYNYLFSEYDYSVMNENNQLQGKINNLKVLSDYLNLVISLFQDEEYLNELGENEFKSNPTWGFTIMRVFKKLSNESSYKIVRLKNVDSDEMFDECIYFDHGMEMDTREERPMKAIFSDGKFLYEKNMDGDYQKLITINMSWVPNYYFQKILNNREALRYNNIRRIDFSSDIATKFYFYLDKLAWKWR